MVADKMVRTKWYGQMAYEQNVIGENGIRTTRYGQNDSNFLHRL